MQYQWLPAATLPSFLRVGLFVAMSESSVLVPLSSLAKDELAALLAPIRMIATDVDGTLTKGRALHPEVVRVIAALTEAGTRVLPISGRPTGEVLGLCRYLPGVDHAISENGLFEVVPDVAPRWLLPPTDRTALMAVGDRLNEEHGAGLVLTADHPFRMGDVAYEREGRDPQVLTKLRTQAAELGVCLVWSSVHIHLTPRKPDKGEGLLRFAADHELDPGTILTIGDAPNDEGLFVGGRFGVTVGTADVPAQRDAFDALPTYVTDEREADAFLQVAAALLDR